MQSNMLLCGVVLFLQASELNRDPRQDEVEEELVMDKNTSKSRGGRPLSSNLSKGGVSDAQYECRFGISPHFSRTRGEGMEERRAEVDSKFSALETKFNAMQNSIELVMAKLGITVPGMASDPSMVEQPSRADKRPLDSRRSVSPPARSQSKEPVSKALNFGSAGEKVTSLSPEIPCGSQKASSWHEEVEQV